MIARVLPFLFLLASRITMATTKVLYLTRCTSYLTPPQQLGNNRHTHGSRFRGRHMDRLRLLDESVKNNEHIIKLTDNAQKKIKQLVAEAERDSLILKLSVKNGGCKGLKYQLNPIRKDEIEADDYVQQFEELKFILAIDATSVIYIYNNILDYSYDLINGGFKFINPNATKKCGCGKSFNV
ncbi:iron-sulfur assembly protein, putative [Plasmodium knowlesi strain H]|uniref:Iron-sulfur assembly protein, putative n=3 Tax=Plasmodium knowlesi TaxID=5850 RepID=A0A5K1VNA6_PLAKH|nr:iron-sulfur cluster assembly protein SufA, putative [Plasmodium knowlesi strain H]OTN67218.1 putative HesB-family member protein [Plasmodium knowlesi]CAA9988608.1 iron-sulfur cluster assembly protein SufA, putative [Plasmodium knowlesi strain H]SBO21442.1 iron-sulfur assembly protein, putative [Plasmodium knowlesi strain H]SBO21882.1 iron-sulfur assembly protein, putative [Plasmodium knowlesi strain H]VVS78082.1 iron-sulfur cluster assembly protein SufA, putative [Plasmodium knowlesi strain|eukprot:XP_002259584.1 HesB-family member protein, putative [Plasmodium knowlesi strain H]